MGQIQLLGCGHACPAHAIDNQQLEKIIDTSDEWIVQRTGIHSRYVASAEETTSVLAARAARQAITAAGIDKKEIRLLIVATLSGDQPMPSTACLVQERLGMMDQPIMAFDLNAACSGFLYALQCACAMLEEGACALVIGAENLSKIIDWSDRGTCILFGDGAGAALIRRSEQGKRIWHFAQSKGDPKRVLDIPGKTLSDVPCVNVEESVSLSAHGWPRGLSLCGGCDGRIHPSGTGKKSVCAGRCRPHHPASGEHPHPGERCPPHETADGTILRQSGPLRQHIGGQRADRAFTGERRGTLTRGNEAVIGRFWRRTDVCRLPDRAVRRRSYVIK